MEDIMAESTNTMEDIMAKIDQENTETNKENTEGSQNLATGAMLTGVGAGFSVLAEDFYGQARTMNNTGTAITRSPTGRPVVSNAYRKTLTQATVAKTLSGIARVGGSVFAAGAALDYSKDSVNSFQKGKYVEGTVYASGAAGTAHLATQLFMGTATSLGTTVAAASTATVAATAGIGAVTGWELGNWIADTYTNPALNYEMNPQDAKELIDKQIASVNLGGKPAYLAGFIDYFNDGFDTSTAGSSLLAQFNRAFTSNQSRTEKLLKTIQSDPQVAYNRGVKGLGGNKGDGANAFLIYEGIKNGARVHGFNELTNLNEIHNGSDIAKSDLSQLLMMNASKNTNTNLITQAKTAEFLLSHGAGYTADDLANAARNPYGELMLSTMLLTVKDKHTGEMRTLYDTKDGKEFQYLAPSPTEEFILPTEMKTEENMNTLMRECLRTKQVSPLKFSAIQQAFNNEGQMKIAADILTATLTNPQKYLGDDVEDNKRWAQEATLTTLCGNKENGYRFHAWEITPSVVNAVGNLDDDRKNAFIQYAQETGLAKDSPEMQTALNNLAPGAFKTQEPVENQQPSVENQDPNASTTPEPIEKISSEKVSWTTNRTVAGPVEHIYKNPVAYERAHARLTGQMYRNVKQKPRYTEKEYEQMLAHIQAYENRGLLPKGTDGKSNAEIYMYKLQQINRLSYDKSLVEVNGEKVAFGDYISENGKNLTARTAEKLLKTKEITPEQEKALIGTLLKTEELVDDNGKMLMAVQAGNNRSYNKDGKKNFEAIQSTQTITETHEEVITGTEVERNQKIAELEQKDIKVTRTPINETETTHEAAHETTQSATSNTNNDTSAKDQSSQTGTSVIARQGCGTPVVLPEGQDVSLVQKQKNETTH